MEISVSFVDIHIMKLAINIDHNIEYFSLQQNVLAHAGAVHISSWYSEWPLAA